MPSLRPARLPQTRIAATYTRLAPVYDPFGLAVGSKARRLALDSAGIRNGERILEVGVGTGLGFVEVLRRNPDGYSEGIDRTPAMLARALRRARKADPDHYRLRPGDARALDVPDGSFDLVFSSYVLDLLDAESLSVVLEECLRVLRPGGRLVVVYHAPGRRWYHRLWHGFAYLPPIFLGGARPIQSAPLLARVGFHNLRRTPVSGFTFPSEIVYAEKPLP